MSKKRKPYLIEELKRILPFLKELGAEEQLRAAKVLGDLVLAAEDRRTMTEKQCAILARRTKKQDEEDALVLVNVTGTIKWFDPTKGYGFITPDDGSEEVLLHVTCLRAAGFQVARVGEKICCEAMRRQRRVQAFRVISLGDKRSHPPLSGH
jgi:cold shock CspA family protein